MTQLVTIARERDGQMASGWFPDGLVPRPGLRLRDRGGAAFVDVEYYIVIGALECAPAPTNKLPVFDWLEVVE